MDLPVQSSAVEQRGAAQRPTVVAPNLMRIWGGNADREQGATAPAEGRSVRPTTARPT